MNLRKFIVIFCALVLATVLYYAYCSPIFILRLFTTEPVEQFIRNSSATSVLSDRSDFVLDVTDLSLFVTNATDKYAMPPVGHIWPRQNITETNDRMVNQINFIDKFWRKENDTNGTSKPVPLRPDQMKVILKVGYFNFETFVEGQSYFIDDKCPINSCTITGNMSVRPTADALIISEFNWGSRSKFLPKPAHQIWIAQHWESPKHNRIDPNSVKDLINWTATYRRDSTLQIGYGHFEPVVNATPITGINYASGKTKRVAWLVSNCYPSNHRKSYVRELSRYIDVDVYGYCGTKKCPAKGSCFEWISRQYKFYLAFENSNCKDYITEKFIWNSLTHNILPIALGARREDYLAASPPNSYIHVDDFHNPRKLAAYLHYLDKNDTAYNTYFAWKGTMVNIDQRYWCRLCTMLHLQERDGYVHWYNDYTTWWNGVCTARGTRLLFFNLPSFAYACIFVFDLFVARLPNQ